MCHAICSILPPHVLHSIARAGTATQRERALRTLAVDTTLRSLRFFAGRAPHRPEPGPAENRSIFDARESEALPGMQVRLEGQPASGDPAVNEAYDGLGATWEFWWQTYHRSSIDDAGRALEATVHFGNGYDNAFWNGERMVFGDGDGELFRRFTVAVDVIGHELGHGVIEAESRLAYLYQPGALNEHLADVFGALVKQRALGQTAEKADWLIGEGLFTDRVQGKALRSMKAPGTAYDDPVLGKDPQPGHMRHYVHTTEDGGGVHLNSGIPNRAFYLAAMGLGPEAPASERAGRVWYETLRDERMKPAIGFLAFAHLTTDVAERILGASASSAVRDAWREVGVV